MSEDVMSDGAGLGRAGGGSVGDMRDDSPWMPPGEGVPTPDATHVTPELPDAAPSLPPSAPSSPPPPPPVSPWAPGGTPPPPAPAGLPGAPPDAPPPVEPPAPIIEPDAGAERPRRSKWLVGGAVASVLAVGAAGVFAVANLADSNDGGATAPDELGFELLAAIEDEDVLGVVDLLLPGEREAFRGPLIEVASELTRLEILSSDFDLSQLAGLDIDFDRETSVVRTTNVDDIVNIDLRADARVTVDGGDLPIGDLFTDNLPDDALTELRGTRTTTTETLDVSLTAVLDDDRWYFSAFHTIAELARSELAPGTPIPATGVGADGTDTPEAAVGQLLDRIEQLDLTGLIRTLNPGEAAALQRYAPLFLEDAEAELAEVPLDWTITDRTVRVEGSGDERTAFLDGLAIEGTIEGNDFTFSVDGSCATAVVDGERFEQCGSGLGNFDEIFGDDLPAFRNLVETTTEAFSDIEPVGLELRSHEGLWYVSVTDTASEALLAVLRALDREELDAIIDAAGAAIEELLGVTLDDITLDDGQLILDDDDLDLLDDDFDVTIDDGFDDGFDDGTIEDPEWFSCYEEIAVDDAIACFDTYLARGEVEPFEVPVALRFPECGYAEVTWTGELWGLSDEEFIAAATDARSCFLDLVEQGQVEAWELPSEITHLECFEGRNWYSVFDDPDYDERYYACVSESFDG